MSGSIHISPDPIVSKHGFSLSSMCHRAKTAMHIHNYVHIWYALAGRCVHTLEDRSYVQEPGTCVTIPPHMPHCVDTTVSDETPVILSVCLNDKFLLSYGYTFCSYFNKRVIFQRYLIPEFYKFTEDDRKVADELARSMLSEFSGYSETILDKLTHKLEAFLRLMCVRCEDSRLSEASIEQATRINDTIMFMEKHYMEKITLDDLCKLTALSHYGFTKKFKEITGLTAMEYIHLLRLHRTQHLLIFTEQSLSKIAEAVGFYDKSRLIHAFSDYFGDSPTNFRKRKRPDSYQQDFNTKKKRDFLRELDRNADGQ
ncbi:MAG: helix-turn-helix domain-containing protein [Oscillospiraceae bacterium]|nr:helix-turn-helix domain-containing protein [Oscillospiraceae bacterium]